MEESKFEPHNKIMKFIEETVKQATDKQIEDCYWLTYEDDDPISSAFCCEREKRKKLVNGKQ